MKVYTNKVHGGKYLVINNFLSYEQDDSVSRIYVLKNLETGNTVGVAAPVLFKYYNQIGA